MPQRLPFFPEVPDHRYTCPLDGVQYSVRLVWRERLGAWFLDFADADGTVIIRGKRIVPATLLLEGVVTTGPPGILTALGTDPYDRFELELWYVPKAEVDALQPVVDSGRVVVIS